MKKRISAIVLALALLCSVSAAAATPRSSNPIKPKATLTVTSSGAQCKLAINPSGVTVSVSGTVSLYRDGEFLDSWSVTSDSFSETYTRSVTHGLYRMDYDVIVKGPYGTDSIESSVTYDY